MNKWRIRASSVFRCVGVVLALGVGAFISSPTVAVGQQEAQIKNILNRVKNYRYGNISVWKVDGESSTAITQLLNPEPTQSDAAKKCPPAIQAEIDSKIEELGCAAGLSDLQQDEVTGKMLKRTEAIEYAKYAVSRKQWECNLAPNLFVITTRYAQGQSYKIISLITSASKSRNTLTILGTPRDILTTSALRSMSAPSGSSAKNLESHLAYSIDQGAFENITADVQGIGDDVFLPPTYGVGQLVKEDNVQQYRRISEGQAMDMKKQNEIIVSFADLISYRRYANPAELGLADSTVNNLLPKYGVELRYGIDEINYPSLFSERVALNALWGAQRLGVILPTSGWSSLSSTLGSTRKLTNAGFGINGAFDFALKATNANTGVFAVSGAYVFGDAKQSEHGTYLGAFNSIDTLSKVGTRSVVNRESFSLTRDYLIRANFSVHYSFATVIDSSYFFRFKIGGALYNREFWELRQSAIVTDTVVNGLSTGSSSSNATSYLKTDNRWIAGVSGRIEFMVTSGSTPYGFGLQYFDESIMGDVWLQVPLNERTAIRFDGKMFSPIFREVREWENESIFFPSARIIYNF